MEDVTHECSVCYAERAMQMGNEVLAYLASGKVHEAEAMMLHRDNLLTALLHSVPELPKEWRHRLLAQSNAIAVAAQKLMEDISRRRDETLASWPALRAYAKSKTANS